MDATFAKRLIQIRPRGYKTEFSLKLKIKPNDWLLADMCPQAANHCAFFSLKNMSALAFNSLLASVDFCRLWITFANSLALK